MLPDGKVTDFRMAVKAERMKKLSLAGYPKESATLLIKDDVGPTDEKDSARPCRLTWQADDQFGRHRQK